MANLDAIRLTRHIRIYPASSEVDNWPYLSIFGSYMIFTSNRVVDREQPPGWSKTTVLHLGSQKLQFDLSIAILAWLYLDLRISRLHVCPFLSTFQL